MFASFDAGAARAAAPDTWIRHDVGRVSGADRWLELDQVNDAGDAVGLGSPDGVRILPLVRYGNGPARFVENLPGSSGGGLHDINVAGVAAGYVLNDTGFHALRYDHGTGTLLGGDNSEALGINDAGVVVVHPMVGDGHPQLWMPDGSVIDMTAGGWAHVLGTDIANGNWISGGVFNDGGMWAPVRWHPDGTLEVLPSPPDALFAIGLRINRHGEVAGFAALPDRTEAVKWHVDGTLEILSSDAAAQAFTINDDGDVVGVTSQPDGSQVGTLWTDGQTRLVDDSTTNRARTTHVVLAISNNGTLAGFSADQKVASVYTPRTQRVVH